MKPEDMNGWTPFPHSGTDVERAGKVPDTPQTRSSAYRLAFADPDFLTSRDLRGIRLLRNDSARYLVGIFSGLCHRRNNRTGGMRGMPNQFPDFSDEIVEAVSQVADLVVALPLQHFCQITLTGGDVAHGSGGLLERTGYPAGDDPGDGNS